MKLYELQKGSKIYEEFLDGSTYSMLDWADIDKMYSYCKTEKGCGVYLYSETPVKAHSDGFVIDKKSYYEIRTRPHSGTGG